MLTLNQRIVKWNKDRGLLAQPAKEVDHVNEIAMIFEEGVECLTSKDSEEARPIALLIAKALKNGNADRLAKLIVAGELDTVKGDEPIIDKPHEDIIDDLNDIIVFATGFQAKLGYYPDIAMEQTLLEIESRTGSIIDGKFIKYKSEVAKSKWIKADYSKAKLL